MSAPLLSPEDPAAYQSVSFGDRWPALVVCDHASRAVPRALANLGLDGASLGRHIAWDIGAGDLALALAARLEVPAVLAGFSRLVIDCNRHLEDASSILPESDGVRVPGNAQVDEAARRARIQEIFEPYHAAVDRELDRLHGRVPAPALIAVHSFTPVMKGLRRPWHCGILWDHDARIPVPMLETLRNEPGLLAGDNEPYSGRDPADYTIDVHAERRGWPHVCIEVRQDLLATPAGVAEWAARLARALEAVLNNAELYRVAKH
jgi:predicted N-formylglutamate amidohydrolase